MKKQDLQTPAILLDLDKLEQNIRSWQALCTKYNKAMWPMIKTHKSAALAKMQLDAGASGFLCGTIDECEMVHRLGAKHIMYAYPTANPVNLNRLMPLAQDAELIVRLDTIEAAHLLDAAAAKAHVTVSYTIIVDMQFHRFGIPAEKVVPFAQALSAFQNLRFRGISTHPGQVYGCTTRAALMEVAQLEIDTMTQAASALADAGFPCEIVSSGSTPTFPIVVAAPAINVCHPGNYTFFDHIQMALGTCGEDACALRVRATVVSNPSDGFYLLDAGSKCLGLDQGAHGNSAIQGFGYVVDHPELTIIGLSEEVAKVQANGTSSLKVGDQVEIIPNHSCSSANHTSWYTCVRGEAVVDFLPVDVRENSQKKGTLSPISNEA